jgi:uncharacterized protein YjbI with pentapeptide repeats
MANLELSLIAIVIAVLVLLFGVWWLWWRLPKWQVNRLALKIRDQKARADVEDNFRKTIGQLLGGAAVLIGAWLTFLQFSQQQDTVRLQQKAAQEQFSQQQEMARLQQKAAQEQFSQQQETAQAQIKQQQQAAQALLISNQVSKGFELLAGPGIEKRLGGIYALEAVMNNSEQPQYHQPVLEALCAFVRETSTSGGKAEKTTTDVQAALTVIGRRAAGPGEVDLGDVSIPGANLVSANLGGADLRGANLGGANLGRANLVSADLSVANLVSANLGRANLGRAKLVSATLSGANLGGADLRGVNLGGATLSGANLGRANLVSADLSGANLGGANLGRANLGGANLRGADLSGANLRGGAFLDGAENLTQAQLDRACGNDTKLPEGLTIMRCPSEPPQVP